MIQRKASNILAGDTTVWIGGPLRVVKKIVDHKRHLVKLTDEYGFRLEVGPDETMDSPDEGHTKSHHLGEFPLSCSECKYELRQEHEYETALEPEVTE